MRRKGAVLLIFIMVAFSMSGCKDGEKNTKEVDDKEQKIQIGLSFDSFVIERWQRDREVFVFTAKELGAEVNVQNANGDINKQKSQIEYFIDKKVDVIVLIAVDSEACADVLKKAKEEGIIVIAYDRLVRNTNADLYISFDNEEVGRLMANTLVKDVPSQGNIITIFGPTSDHNVQLVEKGFNEVIEDSDLNIINSVYAKGWLAEEGYRAVNAALSITEQIDGVLCGNDNLASQAVKALSENRMAGEVIVTGQDAELAACQRIVEGTQTMTVFKPVDKLAKSAAEYAVKLAKGEDIDVKETINDGSYEVPYVKLEPIAVTKENIDEVIIGGGFHYEEDVYLNVPEALE
ncbi:substrate-binding domain-containing protein [Mobilitalea sibirica]|uniref:Substrate-binding domain-containing protein n=1 Tax=Mobilitalea sibirica TaxID=1462919 RepID=A0A8J7HCD5_9FIRM|nr:substrate-binding domain-containing protein [Mobilitalea sibirica]MBH1942245.1 substrate-binding domain-containing protein [Mobilitalea sibirica]